jgi:Nuclease-related domain/UvrD-like helicase C-terminal domain/Uncharacterized conserved protein (DUF2075)
MIPPYYKQNINSNAEAKMFNLLQNSSLEATVLHSLGIADHKDKIFGEIDFLIICEQGILCLEVKGGYVERKQGIWLFENNEGKVTKKEESPFQQVIGNMFSLRGHLVKILGGNHPISKCHFACGVIFPDMTFNSRGIDIIPEIIFDNSFYDKDIKNYIDRVFQYWNAKIKEKHGFSPGKLTAKNINQLENLLRGDFSYVPKLSSIVDEVDNRLVELTTEQYDTFRMVSNNPRMIISGRAGTGKTLIALEQAKRNAVLGKKVLYLCFNRLISSYINHQLSKNQEEEIENLEITNFHELLRRYIDCSDSKEYSPNQFYKEILPERFLEYVAAYGFDKYDVIFIDEGQDLLRLDYLFCINEILQGGLENGSWYLFYDDNQNIYNSVMEEGLNLLTQTRATFANLLVNCRNTQQIGTYNKLLTGFEQGEIMKIQGEDVNRSYYLNKLDLQHKLLSLVKGYLKQGVAPGEIVILSPYSLQNSGLESKEVFRSVCSFQDISSMKYNSILKDSLKFCTIHSFKGMESKVVILIDIEHFLEPKNRKLNYTAISRARVLLHIFYHIDAENEVNQIVKENILETIISH